MPKKKPKPAAELIPRLIKFPADWIARIDDTRGEMAFSEFVRKAVLAQIDNAGLSDMAGWGGSRSK